MQAYLRTAPALLTQPLRLLRSYPPRALRADMVAGVTVGLVLLPQALAFSLLAGLPPTMGVYSAIVASFIGALWGSSSHLNSGPTNTASIITLSVLLPIAAPGSPAFIAAAGMIAVLAGAIRLIMGIARLGMLVNFVSDSVAVGFTAGAGILIISNQVKPLLRINLPASAGLIETAQGTIAQIGSVHLPSLAIGVVTVALIILLPRLTRRIPAVLGAIAVAGLISWGAGLEGRGVEVIGALPAALPSLANLPLLDLDLIGHLANGALALAIIGLVEAVAIARAVASYTHQRLDSNQEFVGQGLANICTGLLSGYPCSGSFNRSALSYHAGGQTAMGNAFSGIFLLAAMFLLGPLMSHLPRAALAGALAVTAYSMVDHKTMGRIWRGAPGDALIMTVTLGATLLLPLQFAVLIGVLMSLGYYLLRTSAPQVHVVVPDPEFRHWIYAPQRPICPQLAVVDILGDLYFGAVNHIEERIADQLQSHPHLRFLLLRMHSVQHCDISGIRALENILRLCRSRGGDLYMVRVREPVLARMRATSFDQLLGDGHILDEDKAIDQLFYHVLDPAVCIYECELRVFQECQNLPKRLQPDIPLLSTQTRMVPNQVQAAQLWEELRGSPPPLVVDVREPREFRQGHIPGAQHLPLTAIFEQPADLPHHQRIVLVCRSGRRSARAAAILATQGYADLRVLQGGMLAWAAANQLEAIG